MSVENLKEYARRCAEEPELRARARAIGTEDMEAHQRHAASLGLDWTMNDMITFRREMVDATGDDESLTEEELEQVAGGAATIVMLAAAVVAAVVTTAAVGAVAGTAAGGGVAAAGKGGW